MTQFPREMLDDPVFQQAFRELAKMAQDPAQREAYERRLNNLREERTRAESFLRKGYNEGRSEGRIEERAAGLRHQIQFLERVLHLPTTSAEQLDSLSLSELEQRATELEQRCLANGTNGQDAPKT